MPAPHIHASVLHAVITFLEFLAIWIPLKIVAAAFAGNAWADAILQVL
jgi:hypothetical protein